MALGLLPEHSAAKHSAAEHAAAEHASAEHAAAEHAAAEHASQSDGSSPPFLWRALPFSYRQRLLKRLLALLSRSGGEEDVHEALLTAYISPDAEAEAGWSTQVFFISDGDASPPSAASAAVMTTAKDANASPAAPLSAQPLLSSAPPPLRLRVFAGIGGGIETGGRVWDAALGLSAYLLRTLVHSPARVVQSRAAMQASHRHVLELGAGPGLPGLMLASFPKAAARVTLTDIVPLTLDNLRCNAASLAASLPLAAAARVSVASYDWCLEADANAARFPGVDLVLAADCIYDPELGAPLLATVRALLRRNPHAVALIAAERRGDAWERFHSKLRPCLGSGELACVDRSAEARAALRSAGCPFWVAADAMERIVLLELSTTASSSTPSQASSAAAAAAAAAVAAAASLASDASAVAAPAGSQHGNEGAITRGSADTIVKSAAGPSWRVAARVLAARRAPSVSFRVVVDSER